MKHHSHRAGAVLVVVVGISMVFAALLLSLTTRLAGGTQESQVLIRQAQAYLMMQAAAMRIYAYPNTTAGGGTGSLNTATYPYADKLGWYYISSAGGGSYTICSAGGSTQGRIMAATSATVNALFTARSLYDKEVLWYFTVTTPATSQLDFSRTGPKITASDDERLRMSGTKATSNQPTWP